METTRSTPSASLPPTPPRSEPGTPYVTRGASRRKKLGWAPPTLEIPPPQPMGNNQQYSANISMMGITPSPSGNPYIYPRKASEYMFSQFNGIKDFTMSTAKSGMGIGEKCSFWCYNQLSKLSRRWFTHIFLTIVIVLYTVGGALIFITIEGPHEVKLIKIDIKPKRSQLLEQLRNLTIRYPSEYSEAEWHGEAVKTLEVYENVVKEEYRVNKLILDNTGPKIWTFWNAVVYCSTVYTTIEIMDASQAPAEHAEDKTGVEIATDGPSVAQLEAMVTPEQVLSASVARKRRSITKRRSASATRTREQTPVRQLIDSRTSSTEEEEEAAIETRPKTPERRRRRVKRIPSGSTKQTDAKIKNEIKNEADAQIKNEADIQIKTESQEQQIKTPETNNNKLKNKSDTGQTSKIDNLVNISQTELLALFDKAKRKISSSRERYKKKVNSKRSHSSPREITELEVLESFKKAQQITAERERQRKRSQSVRKYSTDSIESSCSIEEAVAPKPYRPEVNEFVAKRKKDKQRQFSNKIVEILDPKTSRVITTKEVIHVRFNLLDFLRVLKYFTIKDLFKEYRKFKYDMKDEYDKIRRQRIVCFNEFLAVMILCGLGAVTFKFVEGTFENFYKCGVKRVKRDFIDNLWVKSHNLREEDWKSLARNKLRIFEEELHNAHEAGMHSYSGQKSWSFLNGIIYCMTVITTIGYGHIYPVTTTGQGLTILYALIGIPLFLIILTDFGKLFTRCIKFMWSFVRRVYYTGTCRRARKTTHVEDIFKGAQMMYEIATFRRPSAFAAADTEPAPETDPEAQSEATPTTPAVSNYEINDEFNLPVTLALSILVLYMFLGAVLFGIFEGWDFLLSFYFVFISMSTVGFGDYVPRHPIFKIVSIAYLVFGLALMSMCINVVQDKLSDTFKQASAKIGATIGLTVEDDGSVVTVPPDPVEIPEVHKSETSSNNQPASV